MSEFKIVAPKSTGSDEFLAKLPEAEQFASDGNPEGTKADFGDGNVFVLKAPIGWRWERQRGRQIGSKVSESAPASTGPEHGSESAPDGKSNGKGK